MKYCKRRHPQSKKNVYIRPSGRQECNLCRDITNKKYQVAHRKKIAAYKKEYQQENKDKLAKYLKEYYKLHGAKLRARRHQHYDDNKELTLEKNRQYREENKERIKNLLHRRRVLEASQLGDIDPDLENILLRKQKSKCYYCGVNIKRKGYHQDHRIPLSRRGMHDNKNIVLACAPCNLHKGAMTDKEFLKSARFQEIRGRNRV